jgi:hypothetical protein
MNATDTTSLQAAAGWTRVERFERSASVVLAGKQFVLLETDAEPDFGATVLDDGEGHVHVSDMDDDGGCVFVVQGTQFKRLDRHGRLISTVDLNDYCTAFPDDGGTGSTGEPIERIGSSINASSDGKRLYFEWSSSKTVETRVGRLDLEVGSLDWAIMHPGYSVVFDTEDDSYFSVWPYRDPGVEPGVYAQNFNDDRVERWPIEGMYFNLCFSPDRSHLLASGAFPDDEAYSLSAFDRATGRGRTLDFSGAEASWGSDGRIWWQREENALWVAQSQDGPAERVLWSDELRGDREGSYYAPPAISDDGEWVTWTFQDGERPLTVLLDSATKTYRVLRKWWQPAAWLT